MQERIMSIVFDKDEVTWQSIIYDLVKTNQMDPWDINVSIIAKEFLNMIKSMKTMDFRVPGKVILAATLLLKIKSKKLLEEDITDWDALVASRDEDEDSFYDELEALSYEQPDNYVKKDGYNLIPRTPQPRKRKVSIYDLVGALDKALEVKRRRVAKYIPPSEVIVEAPKKTVDMGTVITQMYSKIKGFIGNTNSKKLTFSQLLPSESKEDKVYTFIPLLHLTNQRKVDLHQKEHFGEIEVELLKAVSTKAAENEISQAS